MAGAQRFARGAPTPRHALVGVGHSPGLSSFRNRLALLPVFSLLFESLRHFPPNKKPPTGGFCLAGAQRFELWTRGFGARSSFLILCGFAGSGGHPGGHPRLFQRKELIKIICLFRRSLALPRLTSFFNYCIIFSKKAIIVRSIFE